MRVFENIVSVTMGFPIVLVVFMIVIVIAMPVLMRVLNSIQVFVHVQVVLVSIVVGVHRTWFRYFASAALSCRDAAPKSQAP